MDASLNGTASDEADPDATIDTGVTVNVTTLAGFADPVAVPVAETLDYSALAVAAPVAETLDFSALAESAQGIDQLIPEAPVEPIQVAMDPTVPRAVTQDDPVADMVSNVAIRPLTGPGSAASDVPPSAVVEDTSDDVGGSTSLLIFRRQSNLQATYAEPTNPPVEVTPTQKAIIRALDNDQCNVKVMTDTVVVDDKTKETQKSEMKYWNEMMVRAKKHVLTAEQLTASAGTFCNVALIKPLPEAELAVVNQALNGRGDQNALIVSAPGVYVARREFQSLCPGFYLVESVIDYYFHCLRQRQNRLNRVAKIKRQFYYFRSAFSQVLQPVPPQTYHYSQVQRWTRKNVPHSDIFKCDAVFFPWNVDLVHWILIVAFMKERKLQAFCSLGMRHKVPTRLVWNYLLDEHRDKHGGAELPHQDKWVLTYSTPFAPRQRNGYDCGVFTCMTADFLSMGWPLIYNQDHVAHCRVRIAHGCLNNCAVTTKAVELLTDDIWLMKYQILVAVLLSRKRFVEILYGQPTEEEMLKEKDKKKNKKGAILGPSFEPKEGERFYLFSHFLEDQEKISDKIRLANSHKADSKLPFNPALKKQDAVRGEQKAIKAAAMELKASFQSLPDPLAGARCLLKLPPKSTKKLTVPERRLLTAPKPTTKLKTPPAPSVAAVAKTTEETEEIDTPMDMEDSEDADVDDRKPAAKTELDEKKPAAKSRDGRRQSLPIQPAKAMHPPVLGFAAVAAQKKLALLLSGKKITPQLEKEEDVQSLEEISDVTDDELNAFIGKQSHRSTADYFEHMKVSKRKREVQTEVLRRNRYKKRIRLTPGEQDAVRLKIKAEKEEQLVQLRLERAAKKKARAELALERENQLVEEQMRKEKLSAYGESQRVMMKLIFSGNKSKIKKGRALLTKQFPTWKYTEEELWEIKMKKNEMGPEQRVAFEKEEEEADEIGSLRYKKATATYNEHFQGMVKTAKGTNGKLLPLLNPMWIRHHFHEKFVAIVVAYGRDSNSWIDVPLGSSRGGKDPEPPSTSVVQGLRCKYQQEDNETCLFFSFASALFYLGLKEDSERVRKAGHQMEHLDADTQLTFLRGLMVQSNKFERNPIVWSGKKTKYFDVFECTSDNPTILIPLGADKGIHHAIATVGNYIFDSTHEEALHLTKDSLDWCCNTKHGFEGVYLAIRFVLKPVKKEYRMYV